MKSEQLIFNRQTGKHKTHAQPGTGCPFCDRNHLQNIYEQQGDIILLKNKYATLKDTTQLVLVESKRHNADISVYSREEWRIILAFAVKRWRQMAASGKFRSVILHKNYGRLSGGTQVHPHMQLIGLKRVDAYKAVCDPVYFEGLEIARDQEAALNVATHPLMGLVELNVVWNSSRQLEVVADMIKAAVIFVVTQYYDGLCNDYNLFFYEVGTHLACKVVPRFVTSPYFVGYQLSQCFDDGGLRTVQAAVAHLYQEIQNSE
ncbi:MULTISPECIES: DUF4931 domain-containing protein [unclassified Ligilactobacillus]|uniref:DUF4931 domain-containing protein n=1 Tax=unclassified Ligilactobacillus TaxID=2767920 RepID=UPI0038548BF2